MFKLQITNYGIIKSAFESISKIVDEITIICDSEGIRINALDRSHITFILMDLQKTLFDEYQCDTPEKLPIDGTEFLKILKTGKANDTLELTVDEGNLIVTFNGDATRTFKIRLIDMSYDNPQPPLLNYPCNINIPSNLIKDYINDMIIFSDKITFLIDEDYLRIRGEGQLGDGEIKYLHGENINESVKSMFNIPKLQEIFKASKFSKECTLHIGDDMPIKIEFKLATGDGELSYLLAPRLEED